MSRKITLRGLKANYNTYEEGDVVYRKYNREWHIYVSTNNFGRKRVERFHNDDIFVKANPALLAALKLASRPFSQINDKIDNHRRNIGKITITGNASTRMITAFEVSDTLPAAVAKKVSKADKKLLEEHPHFAVFLSLGSKED